MMWHLTCPFCGHEDSEEKMRISTCGEYACPKCDVVFQWEPPDEEDEDEGDEADHDPEPRPETRP